MSDNEEYCTGVEFYVTDEDALPFWEQDPFIFWGQAQMLGELKEFNQFCEETDVIVLKELNQPDLEELKYKTEITMWKDKKLSVEFQQFCKETQVIVLNAALYDAELNKLSAELEQLRVETKDEKLKKNELAAELKQLCVETQDGKWKENKPQESAKILHKMGLLYKENTSHKLSLIRSCALLNSAIVRNPSNVETIKKDLDNLCLHLLKISKADQPLANLRNISAKVAEKVKKLRENTGNKLSQLEHIPYEISEAKLKQLECDKIQTVCAIQDDIASQYTSIMQFIAEKCNKIMGKPSCKFAIAGMGSLARKEITPYSDFEHIILLDDNKKLDNSSLEYFRWFSVIFHFIILNLGETIIPSVAIPSLNDYYNKKGISWFFDCYSKGISFDGMAPSSCIFPFGRQEGTLNKPWSTELIQPASEMIKYLDSEEDLNNGYHLAAVLKRTCLIYGDEEIHKQYCDLVKQKLQSMDPFENFTALASEVIKISHTDSFKALNINTEQFNMKQRLFRDISILLTTICDFCKVFFTGFEAINELEKQEIIDSKTSHLLKYALSVACEVRLKLYLKKQGQDDFIDKGNTFDGLNCQPAEELIEAVGAGSLIRCFEIINTCAKGKLTTNKFQLSSYYPSSFFFWAGSLNQHKLVISEWEKQQPLNQIKNDKIGLTIKYYVATAYFDQKNFKKALELLNLIEPHSESGSELDLCCLHVKVQCLTALKRYQETATKSQLFLQEFPTLNRDIGYQLTILESCGYSQRQLNNLKAALSIYSKHSMIDESTLSKWPTEMCEIHRGMGTCNFILGKHKRALKHFNKAETLLNKLTIKPTIVQHGIYADLSKVYTELGERDRALKYCRLANQIYYQYQYQFSNTQ